MCNTQMNNYSYGNDFFPRDPYSSGSFNNGYPSYPSFPQYGPMDNGCQNGEDWRDLMEERKERRHSQEKLKSNKLDLNNDGKFQSGIDGRIVFDWDKDGKISKHDIQKSKDAFKRFDDLWDTDEDDTDSEDAPDIKQFDVNKDGKLDADELKKAGASIWVDRDGDGERSRGEFFEADSIDSRYRKDLKLEIDVKTGNATTSASDEDEDV